MLKNISNSHRSNWNKQLINIKGPGMIRCLIQSFGQEGEALCRFRGGGMKKRRGDNDVIRGIKGWN